jgi:hypothetical protein
VRVDHAVVVVVERGERREPAKQLLAAIDDAVALAIEREPRRRR